MIPPTEITSPNVTNQLTQNAASTSRPLDRRHDPLPPVLLATGAPPLLGVLDGASFVRRTNHSGHFPPILAQDVIGSPYPCSPLQATD